MTPTLITLDIDQLSRNPFQPRQKFDDVKLLHLASSIKQSGVLQPIVARKTAHGYEIVAGERRWRACQKAQINSIPVIIRHFSDEEAAIAAISENTERENLSLVELAYAFSRLNCEFAMTHKEISDLYDMNDKKVTHILRLLTLDEEIQELIDKDLITLGHAKIILSAPKPEHVQLAHAVVKKQWSVRELERQVKVLLTAASPKTNSKDTDIQKLELDISEHVGLATNINYKPKGAGTISFAFSSLDEFEGLLIKLQMQTP